MGREDLVLDRETRRLVAQQLRDQRQIEPLARFDGAVDQLGDQGLPQRTKIDSGDRHFGEPGKADTIGAKRPGHDSIGSAASRLPSHAASVASAGAANCDETSP